ncbi:MAG: hypothetical protein KDD62_14550, partial [Bdellovibrionales bacterium]|nr:hypothetical protein [Bdellovibrionales bacterium]
MSLRKRESLDPTRHKKRALISLAAGIVVGSIILIIQQSLAALIQEELTDELEGHCGCRITLESINVSLLRQSAWVENVSAELSDTNKIEVGEIIGFFDISKVFSKRITITELLFDDTFVSNLGEEGVLQKIIDGFAADPVDPTRKPSWRIKLKSLKVREANAIHEFEKVSLPLTGVSAQLQFRKEGTLINGQVREVRILDSADNDITTVGSFRGQFLAQD